MVLYLKDQICDILRLFIQADCLGIRKYIGSVVFWARAVMMVLIVHVKIEGCILP